MRFGRLSWSIALICAITFLLLLGSWHFFKNIRSSLFNHSVREILEITSQSSFACEVYFRQESAILSELAKTFSRTSPLEPQKIESALPDPTWPTSCAIIDLNQARAWSASAGVKILDAAKLAELEKLPGETGFLPAYNSIFNGNSLMGCYRRFTFANGDPGLIIRGQPTADIASEFTPTFYENRGFSCVVLANGDVLARARHNNQNFVFENLYQTLEKAGNPVGEVEKLHKQLLFSQKGVAHFDYYGKPYILAYVPIGSNSGWNMIAIVPDNIIMSYANQALRYTEIFWTILAVAVFILCSFILVLAHHRRKVAEKEDELRYREQLFNILVRHTNDVFLMLDSRDCSLKYASSNLERVLGISARDIMAHPCLLGLPGITDQSMACAELKAAVPSGQQLVTEGEQLVNGVHKWFLKAVYREKINNNDRFIIYFSDRSRERENQEKLQNALEAANVASAAKSAFMDNMSHDMRTPLNAILGNATLLEKDTLESSKVVKCAEKITRSSRYLLGMINDILDMGNLERGKTPLMLSKFELPEIIGAVESIILPMAQDKNQIFNISVKNVVSEHFLGDRLKICKILLNILTNAVKYTPAGGKISLRVRQVELPDSKVRLFFTVGDNGIGFTKEYAKTIFAPFSREQSSMTNSVQGVGLGLPIAQRLARLMGGKISLRSRKNAGSLFQFQIDLVHGSDEQYSFWHSNGIANALIIGSDERLTSQIKKVIGISGLEANSAATPDGVAALLDNSSTGVTLFIVLEDCDFHEVYRIIKSRVSKPLLFVCEEENYHEFADSGKIDGFISLPFFASNLIKSVESLKLVDGQNGELDGQHMLIVDDNEMNADILSELLAMLGVSSDIATNGQECLEILAKKGPDAYSAVLMDVQMPVMDGHTATRQFRSSAHPRAATLPIIAMTANSYAEDIRKARDCGMNAHLAKPVDIQLLQQKLKELLTGAPGMWLP